MDEKTIISIFSQLLDERDKRLDAMFAERDKQLDAKFDDLKQDIAALDQKIDDKTDELKGFITKNNVAIGEAMTEAFEQADVKVTNLESKVTFLKRG